MMPTQDKPLTDSLTVRPIGEYVRLWKRLVGCQQKYLDVPLGLLIEFLESKDKITPDHPSQYSEDRDWIVTAVKGGGWFSIMKLDQDGEIQRFLNLREFQMDRVMEWIRDFIPQF